MELHALSPRLGLVPARCYHNSFAMDTIATAIGVPPDLLRIAVCIVGSFPLGYAVNKISPTRAWLKDVITTSLGVFFLLGLFKLYWGVLLLLVTSLITYLLAYLYPGKEWMPWANFGVQMLVMLGSHCRDQFGEGDFINSIGITGSQMILVQKLTAFAWDRYDGTLKLEELQSEHEKQKRLTAMPSLLRFFSWVFFFPTIMTGPAVSFRDYSGWIDGSLYVSDSPGSDLSATGAPAASGPVPSGSTVGSSKSSGGIAVTPKYQHANTGGKGKALLRALVPGLVWVALYIKTSDLISYSTMYRENWYLSKPLVVRIFLIYLVGLIYRTKYYAAWLLSDAACITCGISWNGVDPKTGEVKWDRMVNVKPAQVELAQNFHGVFGKWNIITSQWLRHYVYVRVTPKGRKPGTRATFLTFLVSALWHGTRPGYYLTFIMGAVDQTFGKIFRKSFRPFFVDTPLKPLYDVVSIVITQATLGFTAQPFILLNLGPAYESWKSVYFFVLVGMAAGYAVAGPARGVLKKREAKVKKE